ncbi:acyltransferase [Streptomyces sp. ISL-90]|nr:acyltransferase [Streptomyces sp. ISL-90]
MIRDAIDRVYRDARGLESGLDPDLSQRDLIGFLTRMGMLRATAMLKGVGQGYSEPTVKLRSRGHITFGSRVRLGRYVSIDGLSRRGVHLADGVTIDDFAILRGSGVVRNLGVGISIGEHTSIGAHNFLHGGGGIDIGANCLLGPHVSVFTENHRFSEREVPIREQGEERRSVSIGDNVWIGAQSVILAGVTLGSNSIIGAGAVVSKSVEADSIYVGNPARKVRDR